MLSLLYTSTNFKLNYIYLARGIAKIGEQEANNETNVFVK